MKTPRRRDRDDRRSVGSHEEMTAALGRASGWAKAGPFAVKFNPGNTEVERSGHGHVKVGKKGFYDPESVVDVTLYPHEATKGLDNTASGRPENKLPKKGKGRPDMTGIEDAEIK